MTNFEKTVRDICKRLYETGFNDGKNNIAYFPKPIDFNANIIMEAFDEQTRISNSGRKMYKLGLKDGAKMQKPEDWLRTKEFEGYTILDPDGWDRPNYTVSWNTPITKEEMWTRLMKCTIQMTKERNYKIMKEIKTETWANKILVAVYGEEANDPDWTDKPKVVARINEVLNEQLEEIEEKLPKKFEEKEEWLTYTDFKEGGFNSCLDQVHDIINKAKK